MYELTLLRHGRSRADDENKCEGRYDSPLTDIGEQQARNIALSFKKNNVLFDQIITSPLSRAHRTAQIINEQYNVPISIEQLLMEHDNGIIAGMDKTEINKKYPLPDFISPFRYFPEHTGENVIMEHARAGLALSKIIDYGPGKYLVVSHGGILNAIVRNILGVGYMVNESGVSFKLKDNGYIVFNYNEKKHHWKMIKLE